MHRQSDSHGSPENKSGMLTDRDEKDASVMWPHHLADVAEKPFSHGQSEAKRNASDRAKSAASLRQNNTKMATSNLANRTFTKRDVPSGAMKRTTVTQANQARANVGARRVGASREVQAAERSEVLRAHEPNSGRIDVHAEMREAAPLPEFRVDTPTLIGSAETRSARKFDVAEKPSELDSSSIARYIQRFREAPPTSRAERERVSRSADQWWLADVRAGERMAFGSEQSPLKNLHSTVLDRTGTDTDVSVSLAKEKARAREENELRNADFLETQSEAVSDVTRSNAPAVSEEGVSSKAGESESTESDLRARVERYFTNERVARPSAFSTSDHPRLSARPLTSSETKDRSTGGLSAAYGGTQHVFSTPVSPSTRFGDGESDILQRWRLRRRLETARNEVLADNSLSPSRTAISARRFLDFTNPTAPSREPLFRQEESTQKQYHSVKHVRVMFDKECETESRVAVTRNEEAQTEKASSKSVETQVHLDHDQQLSLPQVAEMAAGSEPSTFRSEPSSRTEVNTFRSAFESTTPRSARAADADADLETGNDSSLANQRPDASQRLNETAVRVTETIAETVTDLLFGPLSTDRSAKAGSKSLPSSPPPSNSLAVLEPYSPENPQQSLRLATGGQVPEIRQQPTEIKEKSEIEAVAEKMMTSTEVRAEGDAACAGNEHRDQLPEVPQEPEEDDETIIASFEADPILQYLLERRRKLAARLQLLESNHRAN